MTTRESPTPQFTTAEYAATGAATPCAACHQPIGSTYFKVKGAAVCPQCAAKLRAQMPEDSHAAFARALVFGVAGAVVGMALYVIFAVATGLIIGYVSLAVGFIVGKAMRLGSRGAGGRRYQVTAVLLTYFAVSMSAVAIVLEQSGRRSLPLDALPRLAMVGVASPFLELRNPMQGLIGLVILFVGIRFAWRFTARQTLSLSGPHTAAARAA